jgi:hypothetical protein
MNPEVQPPRLIKGHVQEKLLEARRRTALYCRVKQQVSLDELSEDDLADMQPSGATVLYFFGAVTLATCALIIAAFLLFGSRTVLVAFAITGLVLLCCVVSSIRRLRQDNRRALRLENEYGSRVGTLERRSVPRS